MSSAFYFWLGWLVGITFQFAARKSMDQALSKLLSEIREAADFLQISSRPQPRL